MRGVIYYYMEKKKNYMIFFISPQNSDQHWLYPIGEHLQMIIGEKKESEIKNLLRPLVSDYPDFW